MTGNGLVAGLDAGGTVTTASACDMVGNLLVVLSGPSVNHNSVGTETARKRLGEIMRKLSSACGGREFEAVFIGSSALYREAESEELASLTEGAVSAARVGLNSDLYIAMESLLTDGPCVLAVSGTGSMVLSRDERGRISQTGGWGYILGDEGSAYHMALSALRYALRAYDETEEESGILSAALEFFGAREPRDLIDIFYDPVIEREKVAAFAEKVSGCALGGDRICRDMILKEAGYMARSVLPHLRKIRRPDTKVGVYGGVFLNNRLFADEFRRLVQLEYPRADIGILPFPPYVGALFCAVKLLGRTVSGEFVDNIRRSLDGLPVKQDP